MGVYFIKTKPIYPGRSFLEGNMRMKLRAFQHKNVKDL
jgi:hypothetical protein